MTRATILTLLLGFATLSGCVFPGVHKLAVQQGNIVTDDMLVQLKPGMTANQVEFVMGTPVLKTSLTPGIWNYRYALEENDVLTRSYRVQVFFDENGLFSHYNGEIPPKEKPPEKK